MPLPPKVWARAVVNAAGPWVEDVLATMPAARHQGGVSLVKGSHIIVPRRWAGPQAYIFQNPDGRIQFAIPYQQHFTLIGTTDVLAGDDERAQPAISEAEVEYLCAGVNAFLAEPISRADILSSYAGVRPLYDDGSTDAKAITRDYVLNLGADARPQVLSVFGGKLTTYRRLAEHALEKLAPWLPPMRPAWTDQQPLPGGDLPGGDADAYMAYARQRWGFLDEQQARRMVRAYGTRIGKVLGTAQTRADLGEDFGGGLSGAEVDYLVAHEWARTAQDILWRRTKLGLVTPQGTAEKLTAYLCAKGKAAA